MAYKGGKWTTTDDSILPGARINVIAKERATSILSPRGIAAIPMELDWGAEDEIMAFTRRDYVRDSLYNFGFNYKDPNLRDIDELFKGATELRIGRLNSGGEKARCDLGEAKWSGIRGNDFVVTVEAEADSGYVENPLADVKVDFFVDGDTAKVTSSFRTVPYGYTVVGSVFKDGVEVKGSQVAVTSSDKTNEYAFTINAEPGEYELKAALQKGNTDYTISTQTVTAVFNPETEKTITLTKGTETQVYKGIKKYGFVKTKAELGQIWSQDAVDKAEREENLFYVEFPPKGAWGGAYVAVIEVDGKKYGVHLNPSQESYTKASFGLGNGTNGKTDAGFINEGTEWKTQNIKTAESVDVSGKTVKFSLWRYDKKVDLETLKTEPVEKVIDELSIDCNSSLNKTVKFPIATFDISGDRATVTYKDLPEGATKLTRIKTQGGILLATAPGIIECTQLTSKDIFTFYPTAPAKGTFTIEACMKPQDGKLTVLNSCTYTVSVEGEDREAWVSLEEGAVTPAVYEERIPAKFIVKTFLDDVEVNKQKVKGMYQLRDTDFINWRRDRELELTAGMKLEGGTNGEVTVEKYSDILNKLEIENFHCLGWPIVDEDLQQMAINFTIKMRDEMGIKFQTVMPKTSVPPNYEGIIQYENSVKDQDVKDRDTALTYWVTGQEAGCKVQDSVANMMYDGAYTIDVDYSQRDLENLSENGYFCFHLARGIDAKQYIKVLLDINTLVEPDDTQNDDWKRNQTIRVMDQCCNDVAAIFNNNYFGKVPNTQTGREQLQNDIINHHLELEKIQAIEDFDPDAVVVERGDNKVTVLATDAITPVNAMERLYMTIVII